MPEAKKASPAELVSKFSSFLYPALTLLLAANALFDAAFPPMFPFGAVGGLVIIVLLVAKFFLGRVASKIPGSDMILNGEEEGEKKEGLAEKGKKLEERFKQLKRLKQQLQAAKAGVQAGKAAATKAGPVGLIMMVVEYMVTPMNMFEKVILLFTIALFLPAAAVTPGLILGLVNYGCTAGGNLPDVCSALPGSALDAAIKFLSK